MKTFRQDKLAVKVADTRGEMGRIAAADIRERIIALLQVKSSVHMIFAAAPSQNDVLASLLAYEDIEWERVCAYHMDEYIGLREEDADKSFGTYLTEHIFGKAPFRSIHLIRSTESDAEAECLRYAQILKNNPIDIVAMGIGENGHIAFNDPPVADFQDEKTVKVVKLDEICRQQQVNDGCFSSIDRVPTHAITLTCPALTSAEYLFCIVPAPTKAEAVYHTLHDEISERCPATILRTHENAVLYLDGDSSALL